MSKNRLFSLMLVPVMLLAVGFVATACDPPPLNCKSYSANTNAHDSFTGIGTDHIQWDLFACWGLNSNGAYLARWDPAWGVFPYGATSQQQCVNSRTPVVRGLQFETWDFSIALRMGIGPFSFCSITTNFQCIADVQTPGTIGFTGFGCTRTGGSSLYLDTSNSVVKPHAVAGPKYWFGIVGQKEIQVTRDVYLDFQKRSGHPGSTLSKFTGVINHNQVQGHMA